MISERIESVWDLLSARIAALEAEVVRLNDDACERTKELEAKVADLGDELAEVKAALYDTDWVGGTDD